MNIRKFVHMRLAEGATVETAHVEARAKFPWRIVTMNYVEKIARAWRKERDHAVTKELRS